MTLFVCYLSFRLYFHVSFELWVCGHLYLKLGPGFDSILVPPLPAAISSCAGRARRRMSNGSSDAPRYPAHQRAHRSHLRHRRPRSVPKVVRKVSKCLHLHTAENIYLLDHKAILPLFVEMKGTLLVLDVAQNMQTEICSRSHLRRLSPDAKYWSEKSVTCWR